MIWMQRLGRSCGPPLNTAPTLSNAGHEGWDDVDSRARPLEPTLLGYLTVVGISFAIVGRVSSHVLVKARHPHESGSRRARSRVVMKATRPADEQEVLDVQVQDRCVGRLGLLSVGNNGSRRFDG